MAPSGFQPKEGLHPLYKTRLCRHYKVGKCKAGESCSFAHNADDKRGSPDFQNTSLCATLLRDGICERAGCRYAHSQEQLRASPVMLKTKLCTFFFEGECVVAGACRFAHSMEELQEAAQVQSVRQVALQEAPQLRSSTYDDTRHLLSTSTPFVPTGTWPATAQAPLQPAMPAQGAQIDDPWVVGWTGRDSRWAFEASATQDAPSQAASDAHDEEDNIQVQRPGETIWQAMMDQDGAMQGSKSEVLDGGVPRGLALIRVGPGDEEEQPLD